MVFTSFKMQIFVRKFGFLIMECLFLGQVVSLSFGFFVYGEKWTFCTVQCDNPI